MRDLLENEDMPSFQGSLSLPFLLFGAKATARFSVFVKRFLKISANKKGCHVFFHIAASSSSYLNDIGSSGSLLRFDTILPGGEDRLNVL